MSQRRFCHSVVHVGMDLTAFWLSCMQTSYEQSSKVIARDSVIKSYAFKTDTLWCQKRNTQKEIICWTGEQNPSCGATTRPLHVWLPNGINYKDSSPVLILLPYLLHSLHARYTQTVNLKEQDRRFCHQCSLLVLPHEVKHHQGHKLTYRLSVEQIQKPSHLLQPIENKKTNAVSVSVAF